MLIKRPLCLFAALFAGILFLFGLLPKSPQEKPALEGEQILLEGTVKARERKNEKILYHLSKVSVIGSGRIRGQSQTIQQNKIAQQGLVLCYMDDSSEMPLMIGERVRMQGKIVFFSPAENDGQFDEASYYESKGYCWKIFVSRIEDRSGMKNAFLESMQRIKEDRYRFYEMAAGREQGSVIGAMVLGMRSDMDKEIKDLYQKNGIAHILAISGLHISLLGLSLYKLLCRSGLPLPVSATAGTALVVLYGILTGGSGSVIRAAVMLFLQILGDVLERSYDLITAMAFSGLLLLICNREYLTQAGFLLSFGAVCGIGVLAPVMTEVVSGPLQKWKGKQNRLCKGAVWLIRALIASLSVTLFTLPILLWFYYSYPVYSILLNILLVPLLGIVLISAIAAGLLKIPILLYPACVVLQIYETTCRLAMAFPGHTCITGRPAIWLVILYYLLLAAAVLLPGKIRKKKTGRYKLALCIGAAFLLLTVRCRENRVDMLSVGQGDCIVLQDQEGHVILYDGGSSDVKEAGTYRLIPFLKYHGISHVDGIYLSHPHNDHYSALTELMEKGKREGIGIDCLYVSEAADTSYGQVLLAAKQAGIRTACVERGSRQVFGELSFTVLYPGETAVSEDPNDASMVLYATCGKCSLLLTGDATTLTDDEVMDAMREKGLQHTDILKCEHHGSAQANSKQLLTFLGPEIVLISCGENNSYGHPHKETLMRIREAGADAFVTKDVGQITVKMKKEKMSVAHKFPAVDKTVADHKIDAEK